MSRYTLDPWLKRALPGVRLPADAEFACAYDLDLGVDVIDEETYFRRAAGRDELWLADVCGTGCVVSGPASAEPVSSCLDLLEQLWRSRRRDVWPTEFLRAGLVGRELFEARLRRITAQLEEQRRRASATPSEIVRVAQELGLGPTPSGSEHPHWWARCPGTNHTLDLDANRNEFFCGYCRRKGGAGGLREFVEWRMRRQQAPDPFDERLKRSRRFVRVSDGRGASFGVVGHRNGKPPARGGSE